MGFFLLWLSAGSVGTISAPAGLTFDLAFVPRTSLDVAAAARVELGVALPARTTFDTSWVPAP